MNAHFIIWLTLETVGHGCSPVGPDQRPDSSFKTRGEAPELRYENCVGTVQSQRGSESTGLHVFKMCVHKIIITK